MKTYIAIVIGIVILFAVVFIGYKVTGGTVASNSMQTSESQLRTTSVSGEVKRTFEGDHVLKYSFDIPEDASTSIDMDGALVNVIGSSGTQASVYFSYEGARGYTPEDYISNVVALHVPVINLTGTTTIGGYEWVTAETAGSEWYLSPANNEWLIVIEAKKSSQEATNALLSSMKAQ